MTLAEPLGLSYTTAPFAAAVRAAGPASLEVVLPAPRPTTDICAVLSDVWPDGSAHPMAVRPAATRAYPDIDRARSLRRRRRQRRPALRPLRPREPSGASARSAATTSSCGRSATASAPAIDCVFTSSARRVHPNRRFQRSTRSGSDPASHASCFRCSPATNSPCADHLLQLAQLGIEVLTIGGSERGEVVGQQVRRRELHQLAVLEPHIDDLKWSAVDERGPPTLSRISARAPTTQSVSWALIDRW